MVVQEHHNPHPPDYLDLGSIVGHNLVDISPRYHWRCAWGQLLNIQLQNSSRLEFSDILAAMGLADAILNAVDFALGGKPRVDRLRDSCQCLVASGKCGDYSA